MHYNYSGLIGLVINLLTNVPLLHSGITENCLVKGYFMQNTLPGVENELKQQLIRFLAAQKVQVGIALSIPDQNIYLGINDTVTMHAASTMKVPVMIEVFRQAEQGRFKLTDSLLIKNEFKSIVDQSSYALDIKDDSSEKLYAMLGKKESIYNLVDEMITSSGNLATNLLVEWTGATNIQHTMRQLGAQQIRILRGVEDGKAYRAGLNNTTTARDLTLIFEAIFTGRAAGEKSSRDMIRILSHQKFNEKIPAGLPAGIKVAHKTGGIPGYVEHDAGIVYPADKPPFILTVLTRDFLTEKEASTCIAGIAGMIFDWYTKL
jgi:beta-lactamase class A